MEIRGPIWKRTHDGLYEVEGPAGRYASRSDDFSKEVEAYLAEHPEALIDEPVPPEPSAQEKAAAQRAGIIAQLAELDSKAIRPLRAVAAGVASKEDIDLLVNLDFLAAALRADLAKAAP